MKSSDPKKEEKISKIKTLLANPPEDGLIIWFDEKATIVVKEYGGRLWTDKRRPKVLTRQKSRGNIEMFAFYLPQIGKVYARYFHDKTTAETIQTLQYMKRLFPDKSLCIIWDNRSIHKCALKQPWVKDHQGIQFYPLPTQSAWLNPIERFFGDIDIHVLDNSNFENPEITLKVLKQYLAERNREGVKIRSPLDPVSK